MYNMTLFLLLSITIPLLVGLIAISTPAQQASKALLLHHIVPEKNRPLSLSEINQEAFQQFLKAIVERGATTQPLSATEPGVKLTFDDGFQSNLTIAAAELAKHSMKATFFITTGHLVGKAECDVYGNNPKLTADEIAELASLGHEIGSHSVTHRDLTLLSDDELQRELTESKAQLEEIIKREITLLSFPYGLWNRRVLKAAQAAGYRHFAAYGNHSLAHREAAVTPVQALYPFDTTDEMVEKALNRPTRLSQTAARTRLVPHFAKGSPLAKFDKHYSLRRLLGKFNLLQ